MKYHLSIKSGKLIPPMDGYKFQAKGEIYIIGEYAKGPVYVTKEVWGKTQDEANQKIHTEYENWQAKQIIN